MRRFAAAFATLVLFIGWGTQVAYGQQEEQDNSRPIPTLCKDWFDNEGSYGPFLNPFGKVCGSYTTAEVERIKFVLNEVLGKSRNTFEDVPNVFPNPPVAKRSEIESRQITDNSTGQLVGGISFYSPDGDSYVGTWRTTYQLPPNWVYHFRLHRVPDARKDMVRSKLGSIERSKLYGKFEKSISRDIDLPYFVPGDQYALYSRVYDLADDEVRRAFYFPEEWSKPLGAERIERIWVECAIPIDDNWIPVGTPERRVTPIALQTNKGLYLFSVEVMPQRLSGGMIDHFEGRVFDLSSHPNIPTAFNSVVQTLSTELSKTFEQSPLLSSRVMRRMAPNQIRFERRFESSQILTGIRGPYYELSTYTIILWVGPAERFLGSAESYFARRKQLDTKDSQVFLQVTQALQIAVGKQGDYSEPTPQQYATYKSAVNMAIKSAVTRTAARHRGVRHGDVWKIGPARP